jgi:hypothetical protein
MDAGIAPELLARLPRGVPIVRVVNKIDLMGQEAPAIERDAAGAAHRVGVAVGAHRRGHRCAARALLELAGWQQAGESTFIARERHLQALRGRTGPSGAGAGERHGAGSAARSVRRGAAAGAGAVELDHRGVLGG